MSGGSPLILDGKYRLVRPAGTGGTSNVYLAEEVATGRKVAVKVLKKTLASDESMLLRFDREAKVLTGIKHPNVVGLIHFERAPEGVILLLEWVEGKRLDVLLREGPLGGARALNILLQLASALSAVHAAGIAHRDVKPENIMLEGTDVVRLLDFGIARFTDAALSQHVSNFVSTYTQIGGTPQYMSPEQAMGKPATAATDVYTFGIVAYQLLTNDLPFKGPSHMQFVAQHIDTPPPALVPIDEALKRHAVIPVIMKCLAKDPANRPHDGAALVEAMQAAISGGSKRRLWPF